MRKFIKTIVISAMLFSGLTVMVAPNAVHAQSKADICKGIGLTTEGGSDNCAPGDGPQLESTIAKVINLLSLIVGIISVIMVIIGGMKYILSSGDSNQVNSAKNTILFALVGLVIVALAQVLVRFVINRVTDTSTAAAIMLQLS